MRLYRLLVERIKNPLRKSLLKSQGVVPTYQDKGSRKEYEQNWLKAHKEPGYELEPENKIIRRKYLGLNRWNPVEAERYLNKELESHMLDMAQPAIKANTYEKVFELSGVQVFVDRRYIKDDYSKGSYNWRMVRAGVSRMLRYVRSILPNRKPRIIITDLSKHVVGFSDESCAGMYCKKLIYIDRYYIDNERYYVHEYAHWLADRVSKQVKNMLSDAYLEVLKDYYKTTKAAKAKMKEFSKPNWDLSTSIRDKIAQKIGFPSGYGLINPDEFFAVLIENWHNIKNTPQTYKFKALVKNVLNRL